MIESIIENPEALVEAQTLNLNDEIDAAFDNLLSEQDLETKVEAEEKPSVDFDSMDISSFISSKLAAAEDDISEAKEQSEEEELAGALDAAFANLTGESLDSKIDETVEKAQDLDIDVNFLKESFDNNESENLDQ